MSIVAFDSPEISSQKKTELSALLGVRGSDTVILDFSELEDISAESIGFLTNFTSSLKDEQGLDYVIIASGVLVDRFSTNLSVRAKNVILVDPVRSKTRDPLSITEAMKAFTGGLIEVLNRLAPMKIALEDTSGTQTLSTISSASKTRHYMGYVEVESNHRYHAVITMNEISLIKFVALATGEPVSPMSSSLADWPAEMTNQLASRMKKFFSKHNVKAAVSISRSLNDSELPQILKLSTMVFDYVFSDTENGLTVSLKIVVQRLA